MKKIFLILGMVFFGYTIAAEKSLPPSKEQRPLINPLFQGKHVLKSSAANGRVEKYEAILNFQMVAFLRNKSADIIESRKEDNRSSSSKKQTIFFEDSDSLNLGLDLNFLFGEILFEDTKLKYITSRKRYNRQRKKEEVIYSIGFIYTKDLIQRVSSIIVRPERISGNLNFGNKNVTFGKSYEGKDQTYQYTVVDTTKAPDTSQITTKKVVSDVSSSEKLPVQEEASKLVNQLMSKSLNEPSTINVFFWFERFFSSLKETEYSSWVFMEDHAINIVDAMNIIFYIQGISHIEIISEETRTEDGISFSATAMDFVPEEVPCLGDKMSPCNGLFRTDLGATRTEPGNVPKNYTMQKRRMDAKADLVMVLRAEMDPTSRGGYAFKTDGNSLSYAHMAYAISQLPVDTYLGDVDRYDTALHELGHLLGAGHPRFLNDSVEPDKGVATAFFHTSGCAQYHLHGMRTIMTYHDDVDNINGWRDHWPSECGDDKEYLPFYWRLFSASGEYGWVGNQAVLLGNNLENNRLIIMQRAPWIAAFDTVLTANRPPVARITPSIANDYVVDKYISFNGKKSSDSDGDPLTFFWDLRNALGKSIKTSTNDIFGFTPTYEHPFTLYLTVKDIKNEEHTAAYSFRVTKDELSEPEQIVLSYQKIKDGGTVFNPLYKYVFEWNVSEGMKYYLQKKNLKGTWNDIWNGSASPAFLKETDKPDPFGRIRIRGCSRSAKCVVSNEIVVTNK